MDNTTNKHCMADRLKGTDKNVWVEFGKLAVEYKACNLGQGFPDFSPPQHLIDALGSVVESKNPFMHQYARSYGHPRLINALGKLYSPIIGHSIDPLSDIVISVGAYGALYYTCQGLLNHGDEAIIIEPFFDCYAPMVQAAGGVSKFVPLRPNGSRTTCSSEWKLDYAELESKFSDKTKLLFLNNPNNPLGKVYSESELLTIADLCKKYDVVVVADEVYEWMVYPGNKLIKMASLPGMWDRTITIGSAGKTFSATGWKLGWAIGPEHLIHSLQIVHQNNCFTCPTPLQEAAGIAFETELSRLGSKTCYFNSIVDELSLKRDKLKKVLIDSGFHPIIPEGGYFMMADFSSLKCGFEYDSDSEESKDFQFVKWMTRNIRIATIPPSAFYSLHADIAENFVRFCFIKKDSTLEEASGIMKTYFPS